MNNNLSSFTDILCDEIENSQPISLPSSNSSLGLLGNVNSVITTADVSNRPAKGTGQYGEFRSVEEIDPKYHNIFSHSFFNVVQSRVIDDALYSDKSMVICAPTGSGKTVIFEMAIVQLLMSLDDKNYTGDFKIVYMAPVKALCTERLSEWYPKFTKLGLLCIEVTGDTDVDFSQLKPYRIIITTPEKWDMLTRRWRDHKSLVEVIKLFLIDEVHILNDETRGPVLEAVVSRMKTIETSVQSTHRIEQIQKKYEGSVEVSGDPPRIRFVAVSATVSNPEDVAIWLGTDDKPAAFYKFGDECRPVKLKRIVEGYPCAEGTSIFKFDIILNYKLWPIIQKYHDGKPTLIFCNTRKSVVLTAETLSKELTINFNPEQKARLVALASTTKNKKLQTLIMSGVGCHHAGMLFEERRNIEQAFRNRNLPILITTTTLAMGVNLPAHLVIIKNTQQYVKGAYQEYSISTVLQMVGRAGRPQFDTEATAVIMTRLADKHRYQALVGGNEPLQSFLHKRLTENLNSEAALGTVGDVAQCVQWLRSTFLFVRSARDPRRYLGLPPSAPQSLISKKIEELCVKAMNGLASSGLITMDEASCIESTDAGRLMSIYYLDVETMKNIMKIDGTETLERLLAIVCDSHEMSDMHLRVDERRCLNALNRNSTAATIRFPMKGKISTRQMKLNCIIQAILGCLPITDPSLNQEAMKVMRVADRICKCLVAYVTRPDLISQQPQYFSTILNSIILAKCVTAHLWENSPFVSKQLKGIGPTFSTLLATAGKVNFMLLEESHPRDLERIMNKGPPAGNTLRKQISFLPKYNLTITPKNERTITIQLVLQNLCYLAENIENLTAGEAHKAYIIVGDSDNYVLLLGSFKDKDLISIYDGRITYEITRKRNCEHKIFAHCVSSNFVGIDAQCEFVFKDLETPLDANTEMITKKLTQKQTCITDIFKERKRKNDSVLKTPQSKEKKRRDSTILQKFIELKEPFNQTFDDTLNKNISEGKVASEIPCVANDCNSLHEISSANNAQRFLLGAIKNNNIYQCRDNNVIDLSVSETNLENSDEEYIDDEKINSILDNIESEISKVNKVPKIQHLTSKPTPNSANVIYRRKDESSCTTPQLNMHNIDNVKQITRKFPSNLETGRNVQTKARKTKNVKNNYSFIDILEKNDDCIEDKGNNIVMDNSIGFSSMIKSNIDKYLEMIHHSSKNSDKTIKELLPNTETDNYLPSEDLTQQHIRPKPLGVGTPEKEMNLDLNCKSLRHSNNKTIQNMDISPDVESTLHKIATMKSPQFEDIALDDKITKSNNLIDDNTLIGSLQGNSSSIASIRQNDIESDKRIIRPESIIAVDRNINYDVVNNNFVSDSYSGIQNIEIAANLEYVDQRTMGDKSIASQDRPSNEQPDSLNKIEKLKLLDIDSYGCIDSISKYSFTSTTVSVRSSSDNLVQIIKKMKINLDVTKSKSTNKIAVNKYAKITERKENFDNSHDTKEINPQTSSTILCRAVEKANKSMIAGNYKIEELSEPTQTKLKEIENMANDVNTMPKCITYDELQENKIILLSDNNKLKDTTCDGDRIQLYANIADQDYNHDDNITKDLSGMTWITSNNINNTDLITETDQRNNIAVDKCDGNKIADILKKYSILPCSKNKNQYINNNESTICKTIRQETKKPDRPFKICDIQNIDVDLPPTLVSKTSADNINNFVRTSLPMVKSNAHQDEETCTDIHTFTRLSSAERAENDIQNIEYENSHFEDNDNEMQWPTSVEYPQEPTSDFNIDESMFDPKTLLQCLDNDNSDEIIPPPPEFRDNLDINSTEEIITDRYSPKHGLENDYNSIFSDQCNLELNQCKEIETSILPIEINYDSFLDINPMQTCIPMNTNLSTNKKLLNPIFLRRNKLNQFKFSQKKKMKM